MRSPMSRLCIVGCGLTAAVTASLLRQNLPHIQIIILEKSKGTGGRFCTSRSSFGCSVDLGAQFVTKSTNLSEVQKKCYTQLLETGLLQPLKENVEGLRCSSKTAENFICTHGSGSIVKHFLQTSNCEILFGQRVAKVFASGNKWKIFCENSSEYEFDAVIFTIPVPQFLQLDGILSYVYGKELETLKSVAYSSRFALGLFYDKATSYFDDFSWIAKYISNDDILRFCSLDHRKRNSSAFPSVVVHTTKEFGKKYIDKDDTSGIQQKILNSLEKILPRYPEPTNIKFHKWRYSQVEKSYPGNLGCIVLSKTPLLIAGGDGYSYSTFEGCINSSENIVKNFVKCYN